jgi:hypothetical protein
MAGHKAFQRFFQKFNQATNQQVFAQWYQWFLNHLQFHNFLLVRIYFRAFFSTLGFWDIKWYM